MKKTETITIQKRIEHSQEYTYFRLFFDVPENVEKLEIHYDYERFILHEDSDASYKEEINIIDLALENSEGGYVGASGAGKKTIFLTEHRSTPGYKAQRILPGKWAIIIGAYKIASQGMEVCYEITFTMKKRRLLMGDTHCHTVASDGALSAKALTDLAKDRGLDYLILSDHNNYEQNTRIPERDDLTILPGMEWTHYLGHAGMHGLTRPIQDPFCINDEEGVRRVLGEARYNGALVVLNHPFCPNTGWHFTKDPALFDAVEIVNGGVPEEANRKAIDWWHEQLCEGKRIAAIGGSDFHRMHNGACVGIPATGVYTDEDSPRAILESLKKGHSFIRLHGVPGLSIDITADSGEIGDAVSRNAEVQFAFSGLKKDYTIRIITNQDEESLIVDRNFEKYIIHKHYAEGVSFVRVEVSYRGTLYLVSNPLYFEI